MTNCDITNWEGVPDIIPVVELIYRPMGRDPDVIENDSWSLLTVGVIENDSSIKTVNEVWE